MAGDVGLVIKIAVGAAVAVAGVSVFPPLTSFEAPVQRKQGNAIPASVLKDGGYGYCTRQLSGVDCACFAQKAREVMQNDTERAAGWDYADPWDLARDQASDACS